MRLVIFCLSVLSLSAVTQAQSMPALTRFGEGFQIQKDSDIEVKNMPPVLSQDSMGLCYSYAATTMIQANNCRINKQDCQNLKPEEMFSPLDMARFGNKAEGDISYESSYRGIKDGGPGAYTMEIAALHVGNAASAECMSLDKILSKMDGVQDHQTDAQKLAFERLKKSYEKSKTLDPTCEKCKSDFYDEAYKQICADFNTGKDQAAVLKAFSEQTYEKFLDRLLFPKECARAKNRVYYNGKETSSIELFPKEKKDFNYKAVTKKLKSILEKQLPVMLEGICLEGKPSENCESAHVLVIDGFSRMCDPAGNCYDAVKVQNSWGKTWQNSTNGGWVAAEELFQHTIYKKGMMAWLQDKTTPGK